MFTQIELNRILIKATLIIKIISIASYVYFSTDYGKWKNSNDTQTIKFDCLTNINVYLIKMKTCKYFLFIYENPFY